MDCNFLAISPNRICPSPEGFSRILLHLPKIKLHDSAEAGQGFRLPPRAFLFNGFCGAPGREYKASLYVPRESAANAAPF